MIALLNSLAYYNAPGSLFGNWQTDGWDDNLAWMVNAFLRGYQLTGESTLLTEAEAGWNNGYKQGWDTTVAGIDLGREPAPDETTVCKFRHLLERHELCGRIFAEVNAYLAQQGIQIGTGTIVDATILQAPSSTKNAAGERDPEMHSVRKGKQWYFGMKAHVGVDAGTKLIHSVVATAANVADSRVLGQLLHGEETEVWGDQAYQGQSETLRQHAPKATDRINRRWRSKLKSYPEQREQNRIQSKTRSRVEHVFAVMKLKFGFTRVRYRGLAKNLNRLLTTCALINLCTARNHLREVPAPTCL